MGSETKTPTPPPETVVNEMPVYYVKGNYHRVIHVDGLYGGSSPTMGSIVMNVFSHKVPVPENTVNDAFGNEIVAKRVAKYGIENELEASLVLDLNTAKVMRQWLDSTIKNTEEIVQKLQEMIAKK